MSDTNGAPHMWARDRAYDRRRMVGSPDSLPDMHDDVAVGADSMAAQLEDSATRYANEGNLLYSQSAQRAAARHRQLADYHRQQAQTRRDNIAGHPSTWANDPGVDTSGFAQGADGDTDDNFNPRHLGGL